METLRTEQIKIVVAIDGGECTKWAFDEAVDLIEDKSRDELHLVTVIPKDKAKTPEETLEEARKALRPYGSKAKRLGIKKYVCVASASSQVGAALCNYAREKDANFLVVGRRTLDSLDRLLLGSTSQYCIEHAPCSVIVVKTSSSSSSPPPPSSS